MARKTKIEPTVTFLNEPPAGEKILEALIVTFLEQEGFTVKNFSVKPSPNGKTIINLRNSEEGMKYKIVVGEGVTCERM